MKECLETGQCRRSYLRPALTSEIMSFRIGLWYRCLDHVAFGSRATERDKGNFTAHKSVLAYILGRSYIGSCDANFHMIAWFLESIVWGIVPTYLPEYDIRYAYHVVVTLFLAVRAPQLLK